MNHPKPIPIIEKGKPARELTVKEKIIILVGDMVYSHHPFAHPESELNEGLAWARAQPKNPAREETEPFLMAFCKYNFCQPYVQRELKVMYGRKG